MQSTCYIYHNEIYSSAARSKRVVTPGEINEPLTGRFMSLLLPCLISVNVWTLLQNSGLTAQDWGDEHSDECCALHRPVLEAEWDASLFPEIGRFLLGRSDIIKGIKNVQPSGKASGLLPVL